MTNAMTRKTQFLKVTKVSLRVRKQSEKARKGRCKILDRDGQKVNRKLDC